MEKKQIWAMYFSATGTTQRIVSHVAEKLAEALESQVQQFDFTLPQKRKEVKIFGQNDLVVFGVPVYAGRVPNVLLKYLDTLEGGGALSVPIVLYGNRNYDDALIELRNILENKGFHTIAAGAFIGEHSFSKILAAGRPDAADMKIAEEFAEEIARKLKNATASDLTNALPITVKGEEPIRNYYQPRDGEGNPVDIRKVRPKTSGSCIDCKLCAEVCPMGSIHHENVYDFTGVCIKCGACVKRCPMEAKYYDDESYLYHQDELEKEFQRRAEPELFL